MNKRGFTLVELLAVIVILGVLSAVVIPSVFSMIKNAREDSYNVLVNSFEENARLYATRHRDEVESSLDSYNYYSLTLNDLKEDNLLKTPINDPRTDDPINLSKKIIITRDNDLSLAICYEDKGCYIPTLLVNEITKEGNIVSGSEDGLHYDALSDVYYFRGSNPKNWIEFSGYLWRIVKINTDGSIKLVFEGVKNGSSTTENGKIGISKYSDINSNVYNNATVKTYLQTWYNSNIIDKNKEKVQTTSFCTGKITYDENGTSKDTFISDECSSAITSSIGLLNGSDYLYASTDLNCNSAYKTTGDNATVCKNNNFLYKNAYNYWTIAADNTTSNVWEIKITGSLGVPIASNIDSNVRPVINLISSVIIDRGTGSFDNPYVLKDIVNVDKEKPIINILGSSTVSLEVGSAYSDAGATANDNRDGDLTNKIIIVSDVNINVPGIYTVTYVVSDKSGNKRSASRVVNVEPKSIVNAPILSTGMIPIKWNGTDWVNTSVTDTDWYNYDQKKWANAKTADGSMWVWIPRYVYKITSGWHSNSTGTIDVKFIKGTDDTVSGKLSLVNTGSASDSNGTWTSHPAFKFGDKQVTGIWVAKFEPSVEGTECYTNSNPINCNLTSLVPKFLPNKITWRYSTIETQYNVGRSLETNNSYGWGTSGAGIDTHMMKNVEWGAVAYLSKSIYGKNNEEIWINPSDNITTGCAGDNAMSIATPGCTNSYASTNGIKASTTGNIYGIYDMSGGTNEYVMGNYNNLIGASNLDPTTIEDKYIDRYSTNNYGYNESVYGDAIYETSNDIYLNNALGNVAGSWYNDSSVMIFDGHPWFHRGGAAGDQEGAGVFRFSHLDGSVNASITWRAVILVGDGL